MFSSRQRVAFRFRHAVGTGRPHHLDPLRGERPIDPADQARNPEAALRSLGAAQTEADLADIGFLKLTS
jgi:hypothetical protein